MEDYLIAAVDEKLNSLNKNGNNQEEGKKILFGLEVYSRGYRNAVYTGLFLGALGLLTFIFSAIMQVVSGKDFWGWLMFFSIIGIGLIMAALYFLDNNVKYRYSDGFIKNENKKCLELKNQLEEYFGKNGITGKVEYLITVYKDKLEQINVRDGKIRHIFEVIYIALGSVILFFVTGADKLQTLQDVYNIEITLQIAISLIAVVIVLGVVVFSVQLLSFSFSSKKAKYCSMLSRLKHLNLMLIQGEALDNEQFESLIQTAKSQTGESKEDNQDLKNAVNLNNKATDNSSREEKKQAKGKKK